jgi:hypothetical protein
LETPVAPAHPDGSPEDCWNGYGLPGLGGASTCPFRPRDFTNSRARRNDKESVRVSLGAK